MLYSFNDAKAAERHETQYFEMFGNRGIYHKGWTAVTRHKTPWLLVGETVPPFDDDHWELYDTNKDWSQSHDLAKEMPDKLHQLQRLWLIEATRYNVLPLDDRVAERMNPDLAGRPVLIKGKTQILFGGMGRLSENSVISIKNKSHSVTANIDVPTAGAEGVIIAQGGNIGGWTLYAKGGKLKYCYNLLGIQHFFAESEGKIPAGEHQVRMEFAYAGGGLGKGGTATLFIDGKKVGAVNVAATAAMVFSADDENVDRIAVVAAKFAVRHPVQAHVVIRVGRVPVERVHDRALRHGERDDEGAIGGHLRVRLDHVADRTVGAHDDVVRRHRLPRRHRHHRGKAALDLLHTRAAEDATTARLDRAGEAGEVLEDVKAPLTGKAERRPDVQLAIRDAVDA